MPEGKEESKEEKKIEEKYSVVDVATQSEPRITDGKDIYTIEQALVLALNKLEEMKKKIVG